MKYVFTGKTKVILRNQYSITLRQIQAVVDIPKYGVKSGDIGGWVENDSTLSQKGSCWIDENSMVYGESQVEDDAYISHSEITGNTSVLDQANIKHSTIEGQNSIIEGNAQLQRVTVTDYLAVGKNNFLQRVKVLGELVITGDGCIVSDSEITGHVRLASDKTSIKWSTLSNVLLYEGVHRITSSTISSLKHSRIQDDWTCLEVESIDTTVDILPGGKSTWTNVKVELLSTMVIRSETSFEGVLLKGRSFETKNESKKGVRFHGNYYPDNEGDEKYGIQLDTLMSYFDSTVIEGDVLMKGEWLMTNTKINGIINLISKTRFSELVRCVIEDCVTIHITEHMPGDRAEIYDAHLAGDQILKSVSKIQEYAPK